jgi:Flp pilus assembly pilin Flp
LLLALIALVCVAAVTILGENTTASLNESGSSVTSATG